VKKSSKINRKEPEYVSSEKILEIKRMFFGPYKPEWKDENGIVDNTDSTIAKRVNLSHGSVAFHTNKLSEEHYNNFLKQINSKDYD
jgi:hypothetical protein